MCDNEPATTTRSPPGAVSRALNAASTARRLISSMRSAKPVRDSISREEAKVLAVITSAPAAM